MITKYGVNANFDELSRHRKEKSQKKLEKGIERMILFQIIRSVLAP